jgi:hypothetical protein
MDTVRDWFSYHPVTTINIFITGMIITENSDTDGMDSDKKLFKAKTLLPEIINILVRDQKISKDERSILMEEFKIMDDTGFIDDFARIITDITKRPNLINNLWIGDNKLGRAKNKCFPCKIRGK